MVESSNHNTVTPEPSPRTSMARGIDMNTMSRTVHPTGGGRGREREREGGRERGREGEREEGREGERERGREGGRSGISYWPQLANNWCFIAPLGTAVPDTLPRSFHSPHKQV